MAKRVSILDARPLIARREPFNSSRSSNFFGEIHRPGGYVYTGYLPGSLKSTDTVSQADFIVYSYRTPIAWHIPGEGWIVPPVTYSVSTSRHQQSVRMALSSGDYSPRNLAPAWHVGCTGKAADYLETIRHGGIVIRQPGQRFEPFNKVVATGEAQWLATGSGIAPVDQLPIAPEEA